MIAPLPPIPRADREHIVDHGQAVLRELAGAKILVTGGTGFFGKWILEAVAAANDELGAGMRATVISRDPSRFAAEVPHLAARAEFDWIVGELAALETPRAHFDYLLDFATPSAAEVGAGGTAIVDLCLQRTERLLEFAKAAGVRRILYASSGAVYGNQPADMTCIREDFVADPAGLSPYGRLKQRSEARLLAAGVDCVIARGFAFIGPYLPLTDKFAAGSFIRDALSGPAIRVLGTGAPRRSYMHMADLATWLLALLVKAASGRAYNIGSDQPTTIADLAGRIARAAGSRVEMAATAGTGTSCSNYIPDISRCRDEAGLRVGIPLDDAIIRTLNYHTQHVRQAAAA